MEISNKIEGKVERNLEKDFDDLEKGADGPPPLSVDTGGSGKSPQGMKPPPESLKSKNEDNETVATHTSFGGSTANTKTVGDNSTVITKGEGAEKKEGIDLSNFEFTNSSHMLRLIRVVVYLQYIAVLSNNPYIRLPIIFDTMCRGFLDYLLHWYSRPFLDLAYVTQFIFESPKVLSEAGILRRTLLMFRGGTESGVTDKGWWYKSQINFDFANRPLDFLSDRDWHTIKHFGHFLMSIMFVYACVAFTIWYWEIKDFSDRKHMRKWMAMYVNDGWWRRGGLLFALYMAGIYFSVIGFLFFMFEMATSFKPPDIRAVGAVFAVGLAVILGSTMFAFMGFRSAEVAFVRYVSQNVGYTSTIIMKRVVKAKTEIGLGLMFFVLIPALYTFTQGIIVVVDWNDFDPSIYDFRKAANFYVPCYFLAFPPFHDNIQKNLGVLADRMDELDDEDSAPEKVCSVQGTAPGENILNMPAHDHRPLHVDDENYGKYFFEDRPILQCDGHFGIAMYTTSLFLVVITTLSYVWIFYSIIRLVILEFRESSWVKPMYAVQDNLQFAEEKYVRDFPHAQGFRRIVKDTYLTIADFLHRILSGIYGSISDALSGLVGFLRLASVPVYYVFSFLFKQCCGYFTVDQRRMRAIQKVILAKKERKRVEALEKLARYHEMRESGRYEVGSMKHTDGGLNEGVGRRIDFNDTEADTSEEEAAAGEILSLAEMVGDVIAWVMDIGPGIIRCYRGVKRNVSKAIRRNHYIAIARVHISKMVSIGKASPVKARGAKGEWRREMSIKYRESQMIKMRRKLATQLQEVRTEFVADHALTITVFDRVVDTGGIFMLIAPYRWLRLDWTLALVIEMVIIAIIGAITNYNEIFIPDWTARCLLVAFIVFVFLVLTIIVSPYTDFADGLIDIFGRLMVIVAAIGLVQCEAIRKAAEDDVTEKKPLDPYLSGETLDLYNMFSFSDSNKNNYFGQMGTKSDKDRTNLDILTDYWAEAPATYRYTDALITAYMYSFVIGIMWHVGVFRVFVRKYRGMMNSMHDSILDFLVAKVDERVIGAENIYTGLILVQQWDDILEAQRRDGLIPFPDVRPQSLLSFSDKMFQVKWASAFNLTIPNLRSTLGLNLLHTSMCSGDGEASRWLMHKYPDLINREDSQRDTPLMIALKECAFFLAVYSKLGRGRLDDGTSYSDDDLVEYYPEIERIRDEIHHDGECLMEYVEIYILNAKELTTLSETASFTELQDDEEKKLSLKGVGQVKPAEPVTSPKGDASPTKGKKNEPLKKGENQLFKVRFPEDTVNDDFETGQMAAWAILMLDVPNNNLQMNDYGDDGDEDFGKYEQDLRQSVRVGKKITKIVGKEKVPRDHPDVMELKDFGEGALKSKAEIQRMSTLGRITHYAGFGSGDDNSIASGLESRSGADASSDREVRWKICKFAEIFLSQEVANFKDGITWNVDHFAAMNKMANKLQALLAQHMSLACDLNPPRGYVRLSDWTLGLPEDVHDDYDEDFLEDHHLKNVVDIVETSQRLGRSIVSMTTKVAGPLVNAMTSRMPGNFKWLGRAMQENSKENNEFNDRIVQYLSECFVATRERLVLPDCELGGPARVAFRGIMRSLRRRNCSFILPSMFVAPRRLSIISLELSKNELDCGDCMLLADVMLNQKLVYYIDLSHNRIGARGFVKLIQSFKGHPHIRTVRVDYNRIGPGCGKELGLALRQTDTLQILTMSHNRMGDLVRYRTSQKREMIPSACRDILYGFRGNTTLKIFDLSYNHMGPKLADLFPMCYLRHPCIVSMNMSGNDMGDRRVHAMLYALAGQPGRDKMIIEESTMRRKGLEKALEEAKEAAAKNAEENAESKKKKKVKRPMKWGKVKGQNSTLAEIGLADNQLGAFCGKAAGVLCANKKSLTSLDMSNNNLGSIGGLEFGEELERLFGVPIRDEKKALRMVQSEDEMRKKTKKVIYSNLIALNLSRNGLGPNAIGSIMQSCARPGCTITDLDVSNNRFGASTELGGYAPRAAIDTRFGLASNKSLTKLNLSDTGFVPSDMLAVLGGLTQNKSLIKLNLSGMILDEPCCLLMSNAIKSCESIDEIVLPGSNTGPKGGGIFLNQVQQNVSRFVKLDLRDNMLGTYSMLPLSLCLEDVNTNIHTLYLNNNLMEDEGGQLIINALEHNKVLTDLDISDNRLTKETAVALARIVRGNFEDGRKIQDSVIKRLVVNNNPEFGRDGCLALIEALTGGCAEHIEMVGCGAGPSTGRVIGKALRTANLTWRFLDISHNDIQRAGLNHMMWSLRHNRSLRILRLAYNNAGGLFGTDEDAYGLHGIAVYRAIVENLALREFDLSGNNISSEGGSNILEALLQNQTLRIFRMAHNFLDDECSVNLGDLITYNDVIEQLDLSHNKMGFHCCLSLAQGLQVNRAIQILDVGYNRLGNAGKATLDHMYIALCVNTSMRVFILDGNRLGPQWGRRLAEGLVRNSTLIKVGFVLTRLDPSSGKALLAVYEANQYIKEFGVSIDEVGEPLYKNFQRCYSRKRAVDYDHILAEEHLTPVVIDDAALVKCYSHTHRSPGRGGDDIFPRDHLKDKADT